jgi:hypothetical protein
MILVTKCKEVIPNQRLLFAGFFAQRFLNLSLSATKDGSVLQLGLPLDFGRSKLTARNSPRC